ncbi:MAG: endonuclease/exonuclease/phosphatase family protein [bacterium]|nr:endonuclease/exonuclease/phosphatase family protein [bacterium]
MSVALKLISLNIEKSKHLDLIVPFLEKQMPDVFCVQEIYESSIATISAALGGAEHVFIPMTGRPRETPPEIQGVGIFSRLSIRRHEVKYYVGTAETVPNSVQNDPATYNLNNRMVIICDIEKYGKIFRIANTHFTWTPDGNTSEEQRTDMRTLLDILHEVKEFVLAGDFNAPRGGEIFSMLAERYKDNIPPKYKTSLDIALHHAGKLRSRELADKMVDGIFSTPGYEVSNVQLISGVSDHCTVVAEVIPND